MTYTPSVGTPTNEGEPEASAEAVQDCIRRAMTNDGGFRVMTAITTQTTQGVLDAQGATGEPALLLADLTTAAILVRETMSPSERVQIILVDRHARAQIVADSNPDGTSRGLLRVPSDMTHFELGKGSRLQTMRSLPNGELHRSTIEVPVGATVSEMMKVYMKDSEQIDSAISMGTRMADGKVEAAGGYLVQLLPELDEPTWMIMQERLKDFKDAKAILGKSIRGAEHLMEEILYGMPYTDLESSPLSSGCSCSLVRVMTSLATLPRTEIKSMIEDGEVVELTCDYCNTVYHVGPEQLKALIEEAS